ncbi:hypothetical protein NET03_02260 [Thermomicrobium sp. CFH 73360]|uniref:MqnA/MqnD/SBP family protein n=1 Tax=Thermomicrobium sp. CFH 73360 TaxID=2951987 RepID=UPI00207679D7|nr:MqnA/MqnD/SBP family protein [Thermomicrobium sp. CFH 73360]MCM8745349.1 hypothetical protein [Thermomicrobium sp. CFH 73360]
MSRSVFWLDQSLIGRVLADLLGSVIAPTGWDVRQAARLRATTVRTEPGFALLDTLEALELVPAWSIATDLVVASQYNSAVGLVTPDRPDRITDAIVSLDDCRPASEALARATIEPFFGLRVRDWRHAEAASALSELRVTEDEAALVPLDERHHDLGRIWFILTGHAFVSHLLVVPSELPAETRSQFAVLLRRLSEELRTRAAEIASERAAAHALDAGRLHAYLSESVDVLTPKLQRAIAELVRRSGSGLRVPGPENYRSLSS